MRKCKSRATARERASGHARKGITCKFSVSALVYSAMVLGNQGCCGIEEFDEMKNQHQVNLVLIFNF